MFVWGLNLDHLLQVLGTSVAFGDVVIWLDFDFLFYENFT